MKPAVKKSRGQPKKPSKDQKSICYGVRVTEKMGKQLSKLEKKEKRKVTAIIRSAIEQYIELREGI